MASMPLSKIRHFGGKLGAELEERFGAKTAGDVTHNVPFQTLAAAFQPEDRARWIYAYLSGECHEAVVPKEKAKSLMAAKSFEVRND
jgi:nucleotidyltransferase/DNA polymerase involved in DNA repair